MAVLASVVVGASLALAFDVLLVLVAVFVVAVVVSDLMCSSRGMSASLEEVAVARDEGVADTSDDETEEL